MEKWGTTINAMDPPGSSKGKILYFHWFNTRPIKIHIKCAFEMKVQEKTNLDEIKKSSLFKQIMKHRKLTPEQEKILEERKKINEYWAALKPTGRRKVLEIEKNSLLREIKENHRHVCSCSVCGRKRAFIDKEIERFFVEYCKELEHRGSRPEERTNFEILKQKIIQQKQQMELQEKLSGNRTVDPNKNMKLQFNDKTIEFKENSIILKQQISKGQQKDEFDEIEVSKDDYISWNFGRNLVIVNGNITLTNDWLEHNKGNILEILSRLEQIERQDGFLMYPSIHHKKEAAERLERLKMERVERLERSERKEKERIREKLESLNAETEKEEIPEENETSQEEEEEEEEDDSDDYEDEEEDFDAEFAEEERWRESRRMFRLYTAKLLFKTVILAYKEKCAHEMQKELIDEEEKTKKKSGKKASGPKKKKEKQVKGKKKKNGKIEEEDEEVVEEEQPNEQVEEEFVENVQEEETQEEQVPIEPEIAVEIKKDEIVDRKIVIGSVDLTKTVGFEKKVSTTSVFKKTQEYSLF